jgi:hypothetical protein
VDLECEWNFDAVPDRELIACCFWEYARESGFIRSVRERCLQNWRTGGHRDQKLHDDLVTIQGIGYPSEVFMRGFFFEPDVEYQGQDEKSPNHRHPDAPPITGSFPKPWRQLPAKECACRAHISTDKARIPLVPFHRGQWFEARDIADWAAGRRWDIDSANQQVRRENPDKSEDELLRDGKLKLLEIQPSLFYESGSELTVVAIQWADFTNDEIAAYFRQWVKTNRPGSIPAPNGQGQKLNDWRVALHRLGVMRALHAHSFADHRFPPALKARGEKHCYQARKLALKKFHGLFSFLPSNEKPLSWDTHGGRTK